MSAPPHEFKQRNILYLRVGKTTVVPLRLILHDPSHFTSALFQEVVQCLQNLLPTHLISVNSGETPAETFVSDNIRFSYKYYPTQPRYCVVSRVRKTDDAPMQDTDEVYEGGRYRGFTISRNTIEVETLPPAAPSSSPPPQSSISRYFIASDPKKKASK